MLDFIEWGNKKENIEDGKELLNDGIKVYRKAKKSNDKELYRKALRFFLEAKEEGNTRAYHYIAKVYYRLGDKKNNLLYLKKGEKVGDRKSIYYLGKVYHNGTGVKKDKEMAEYFYKRAIKKDVIGAIESIYNMYKDDKEKLESVVNWYANLGERRKNGQMMYNSALFYIDDENGIPQDRLKALNYLKKGMHFNCDRAALELAKMYMYDIKKILDNLYDKFPKEVEIFKSQIIQDMRKK